MENERDGKALEEGMVRMDIYVSIILLISIQKKEVYTVENKS
jgi:hypothetical protein